MEDCLTVGANQDCRSLVGLNINGSLSKTSRNSIVFASREAHEAWRDDPAHRAAQERGRSEWYESYSIQVCQLLTDRGFDRNV